MDYFSRYNQIQIKPEDQHKTAFICPWGTFSYQKIPFSLKNAGVTFQWAMTLIFHDLKIIIKVYLDDLAAHSRFREASSIPFEVSIRKMPPLPSALNPHKCASFACLLVTC